MGSAPIWARLAVRGGTIGGWRKGGSPAHAGISSRLAAFHLDKLVELGLLATHYARKPGRSGPGAGRTSKFNRPSELELDISIPERRYAFLGEILVAAIAAEDRDESAREAAVRIVGEHGRAVGMAARLS